MNEQDQPTLPGFEQAPPSSNHISAAATKQLEELRQSGALNESHAIIEQLVLSLSQSVGDSLSSGKLTIAGVQGAKLLMDALELLPEGEGSAMAEVLAELRAVS